MRTLFSSFKYLYIVLESLNTLYWFHVITPISNCYIENENGIF